LLIKATFILPTDVGSDEKSMDFFGRNELMIYLGINKNISTIEKINLSNIEP